MVWVLDPKDKRKCRLEGSRGKKGGKNPKPADYYMCVKSRLPSIWKAKIKLNSDLKTQDINFKKEKQDKYDRGFQHPCEGDSGAGNWIQKDGRAILVGVMSFATECGDSSHILRTTDAAVMKFIREFAQFGDHNRRK